MVVLPVTLVMETPVCFQPENNMDFHARISEVRQNIACSLGTRISGKAKLKNSCPHTSQPTCQGNTNID